MIIRINKFIFLYFFSVFITLGIYSIFSFQQLLTNESFYKFTDSNNEEKIINQNLLKVDFPILENEYKIIEINSKKNILVFTKENFKQKFLIYIFFVIHILIYIFVIRTNFFHNLYSKIYNINNKLKIYDYLILCSFLIFSFMKISIIDMIPLGIITEKLQYNINFYVISYIQSMDNNLTIFPYNPLALLFMVYNSSLNYILDFFNLTINASSTLNLILSIFYIWLCVEITLIVKFYGISNLNSKRIFYLTLFNPLGIYYTLFLGQIDIISITFILFGLRLLFFGNTKVGVLFIILALVFAKPQHLLLLIIFLIASTMFKKKDLNNYIFNMIFIIVSIIFIYYIYKFVPSFYESLSVNTQKYRLSWSTWWQLFDGAILINRPISFLLIYTSILVYIFPNNLEKDKIFIYIILSIGGLYSSFQASYGHTFGLTIFILPSLVLISFYSQNLIKFIYLYILSFFSIISWGTGLVGDVTNSFGLNYFHNLVDKKIIGIRYSDFINTLEFVSLFIIAIFCLSMINQLNKSIRE